MKLTKAQLRQLIESELAEITDQERMEIGRARLLSGEEGYTVESILLQLRDVLTVDEQETLADELKRMSAGPQRGDPGTSTHNVRESKIRTYIQEELQICLQELGSSAAASALRRSAQLSTGATPVVQDNDPESSLGGLVAELRTLLEEWEEKEYPSDEARYEGYYRDIEEVTERYDPCAHPGESCEDAHPGQEHEECIRDNEESDEE